ncbi:MAG: universal stress protein [Proteobacteria bacterium]|nr:universal stress protein [Pseudomonadota bacterium]
MAIKTILVPIDGSEESFAAFDRAVVVADRFGSHIKALHVMLRSSDIAAAGLYNLPARFRKEAQIEADRVAVERAAELQQEFEAHCSTHNIRISDQPGGQPGLTAAWLQESGHVDEVLTHHGRASDVIAVSRPRFREGTLHRSPMGQAIEAIMLRTGRPVLINPPESLARRYDRAAIGWNDSVECSRALAMTMPWLVEMKQVTIIVAKKLEESVKTLVEYLAWHGVKADVATLNRKGRPTGECLLRVCSEVGAEFLIVGGFSHSRASQLLFGGVTQYLMTESNIVTIMVH